MTITKKDVQDFFEKLEAKAGEGAQDAEIELKKGLALAGSFLRSTVATLARDPAVLAVIKGGFDAAIVGIEAAVTGGGAALLPGLCLEEGKKLAIAAGLTAEHEIVPIVAGELHAALAARTAATPEHVNQ